MFQMRSVIYFSVLVGTLFSLSSCSRKREQVWDDTSSCYRHMTRGLSSLCGRPSETSRQIRSRDEFYCPEDEYCSNFTLQPQEIEYYDPYAQNYAQLQESKSEEIAMADFVVRPPKDSPGDPGSPIPGIESFKDPMQDKALRKIFKNVSFPYNSNLIKGSSNLDTVHAVVDYLKAHPSVYVFIEGHCDERGAQQYNLALGSRRANAVRNLLIEQGVNPNNLFTTSYGSERPIDPTHDEQAWAVNRRAEFKLYER